MKLRDIARLIGGEVKGDPEMEIISVSGLEDVSEGGITFVLSSRQVEEASRSGASCVMVKEYFPGLAKTQLKVDDPRYAFAVLLGHFHGQPVAPAGISSLAYLAEGVTLGDGVTVCAFAFVSERVSIGRGTLISPGVFIGPGVKVGEDCIIKPSVVLMDGTVLGDRVVIHAGTVVGSDGFGYLQREERHFKVPQVGGVLIGDDVEIGACAAIDRATTGRTVIGRGTKLDNLVHVAHNVTVGEDAVITAQVAIAGSSRVGSRCMLGGQSGVSDHTSLEDDTILTGRAGAIGRVGKGVYSGYPLLPHREWLKAASLFGRLPELLKRIKALEEKSKETEGGQGNDEHQ